VNLPFAESSEQNKRFIYDVIQPYLQGEILEIGSGTGQHAVFFAGQAPQISWQTSEVASNLPGIEAWIADSELSNLPSPIALDVLGEWPQRQFDMVYSANCFHIMGREAVAKCIAGVGACLKGDGVLVVYGPFNYAGSFTSPSNARFDAFLKARDPASGIKDFEWVDNLAAQVNLQLVQDVTMPENNRSLVWQKRTL
jgi:cyclopropane fatty-acyl-phospholipid synthase-like methyltransferase